LSSKTKSEVGLGVDYEDQRLFFVFLFKSLTDQSNYLIGDLFGGGEINHHPPRLEKKKPQDNLDLPRGESSNC